MAFLHILLLWCFCFLAKLEFSSGESRRHVLFPPWAESWWVYTITGPCNKSNRICSWTRNDYLGMFCVQCLLNSLWCDSILVNIQVFLSRGIFLSYCFVTFVFVNICRLLGKPTIFHIKHYECDASSYTRNVHFRGARNFTLNRMPSA